MSGTGFDFTRTFDLLDYQAQKYPLRQSLLGLVENKWVGLSTKEAVSGVEQFAVRLKKWNVNQGDRIGFFTNMGSPELLVADLGSQKAGIIPIIIHNYLHLEDFSYLIQDAQINIIFHAPDVEIMDYQKTVPELKWIPFHNQQKDGLFDGEVSAQNYQFPEIIPEDIATIVYTSGSSGIQKGVCLTHSNLVSNIKSVLPLVPIKPGHRSLSLLPISHIFERMVIYTYLAAGLSIHFVKGPAEGFKEIVRVRPHFLTVVPRILEKVYENLMVQLKDSPWIHKNIYLWAIEIGKKYGKGIKKSPGWWFKLGILKILVFRRWKKLLGGEVKGILVGASALNEQLARMFSAAGIKIREGYGMTETSPVISMNRFEPGGNRFGTAGIPIPGVNVRIDNPDENGNGEILVKGPGVMIGYTDQVATKQAFHEGWLRTGDIGRWIDKRFLQITDRKNDVIKTSSGKFIYPLIIEQLLEKSPYIDHAVIIGYQRSFVTALLIPEMKSLEKWCHQNKVHWTAGAYMVHNPEVVNFYQNIIDRINQGLMHHEQIKRFTLIGDQWQVDSGEITTTWKLRRKQIFEKYRKVIDNMYKVLP